MRIGRRSYSFSKVSPNTRAHCTHTRAQTHTRSYTHTRARALALTGMPLPTSFGFPGSDGTFCSNFYHFLINNHPFFSIFGAHPMHPFNRYERSVVTLYGVIRWYTHSFHRLLERPRSIIWICTIFWNFFVNAYMNVIDAGTEGEWTGTWGAHIGDFYIWRETTKITLIIVYVSSSTSNDITALEMIPVLL